MIALIDHGAGNLRSVHKALEFVGAKVTLTADPDVILSAEKVVLPGVGAFGDCMAGLRARGLEEVVRAAARQGQPLLGICVGMQMFFETSDEMGQHPGLGLLKGRVTRFTAAGLKIPQTGWNQVRPAKESPLLAGIQPGDYVYFNHSYYCLPADAPDILTETHYGQSYASSVAQGNLYGVQFHPEKSQGVGLRLLKNFVENCQ